MKINVWWLLPAVVVGVMIETVADYHYSTPLRDVLAEAGCAPKQEVATKSVRPAPGVASISLDALVPLGPVGYLMCSTRELSPEALAQIRDATR